MRTPHAVVPTLLLLATAALAPPAFGFGEDVCFPGDGGRLTSCLPLPEVCRPVGTTNPACRAAMVRLVARGNQFDGGRSTVHHDATYVLAQAVGFPPEDAYWIAAYDEATDLGVFTPRDERGRPVGDGALTTASLSGLRRTNLASGGALLHYVTPYHGGADEPVLDVDGLVPDPTDADVEVTLANLRAWAFAASSADAPMCTAGLTVPSRRGDLATGPVCYDPGTPIGGVISLIAPLDLTLDTETGPQLVDDTHGDVYADDFDALVATDGAHDPSPEHASDARIGVYLHVLADRVSHHRCGDTAVLAGPDDDGFFADLGSRQCDQPIHFLRHAWETGVPYRRLDPEDRTTVAALETVYDELVAFAAARGVLRPGARSPLAKEALLTPMLLVLQASEALDRVRGLHAVACRNGLAPLPGQPACR